MFSRRNMLLLRACQVLPLEGSPCRHSKVDVHEAARPFSEGPTSWDRILDFVEELKVHRLRAVKDERSASPPVVAAFARDVDQHMRTQLGDALRPHVPRGLWYRRSIGFLPERLCCRQPELLALGPTRPSGYPPFRGPRLSGGALICARNRVAICQRPMCLRVAPGSGDDWSE